MGVAGSAAFAPTPLWPAGHLPLKGGDQTSRWLLPTCNAGEWAARLKLLISPPEGEMAGRPEGGAPQKNQWRHPFAETYGRA